MYTEAELMRGLRKAHDAGDTKAAQAIARRIKKMRDEAASTPVVAQDEIPAPVANDSEGYSRPIEAARSGLRGATIGLSDVLGAAGGAGGYKALEAVGLVPDSGQSYKELYAEMKKNQSSTRDKYREDYPVESVATEIGGAVLPAIATAGGSILPQVTTTGGRVALGGAVLPAIATAGGSILPQVTTTGGRVALGAGSGLVQGGIYGATQADTDKVGEGLKEGATLGAIVGGALPVVVSSIGRVISPKASRNANLAKVLKMGGKPTIGQALGGRWATAESKLSSLPITGDMINIAQRKALDSVEPVVYNRALAPIGKSLPKNATGRDAFIYADDALKAEYDDVLAKIGAVNVDDTFVQKQASLKKMVDDLQIPAGEKAKFGMAIDDIAGTVDENGIMTSQGFKELQSNLKKMQRNMATSQNVYDNKLSKAVQQLNAELEGMLERQAGKEAARLKDVNKAFANFSVIKEGATRLGAEEGKITPSILQSAVRGANKSKGKKQFGRGEALLQDVSDPFVSVMGKTTPNSFTADRMLLSAGALGLGSLNPIIPISLGAGGVMYTQPAQRALVNAVAKRPDFAPKLADILRRGSDRAVYPAVNYALQE